MLGGAPLEADLFCRGVERTAGGVGEEYRMKHVELVSESDRSAMVVLSKREHSEEEEVRRRFLLPPTPPLVLN